MEFVALLLFLAGLTSNIDAFARVSPSGVSFYVNNVDDKFHQYIIEVDVCRVGRFSAHLSAMYGPEGKTQDFSQCMGTL